MAISYSLVARRYVVLAEFQAASAPLDAGFTARQILQKSQPQLGTDGDGNMSFSHYRYVFHVKRTDGLTVLCVANDSFGRRIPFSFLEGIHQRFVRTYGRAILTAPAYAMNDEFSRVLNQQMDHFSNNPNADRIDRLKGEMSQVRNVMMDNIEKVLERGDRLELLVNKTMAFQGNAFRFRRQSQRYRNMLWWRNVKFTVMLVFLILVIVYISYLFVAILCWSPAKSYQVIE